MADPAAAPMTIDFLRARLLSERSVSRASKERADQLAARVAELEEQVRAVTAQRRQAEREAAEVLAVLQSQGFCASLDSGSDNDADEKEQDEPRHAMVTGSHGEEGQEQEQPPAKGEAEKEEEEALSGMAAQQEQPGGGLSWKGRCASPRKARQLRQRHRRSYVYILASEPDPSPKYRLGQSCRKNKRKELSNSVAVPVESRKEQRNGPRGADDGRTKLDGEAGGDDQRSSGDGGDGGQYVVRYDNGGEMERVLEKQAELIGQHEAQEKAQTDWERQFNGNQASPANKGDVEADCQVSQDKSRGENSDGSSSGHTNSVSSAIEAPSESSPSISKASDWSSSRFHDHAADDDTRSCRRWSGDVADVESVLQALQRARISLRQKLDRPLPPSQVTLALPAPGDEYRGNEDDLCSNGNSSYRGSSPCRQETLALPAPEDYHDHEQASAYFSADGANTLLTEIPSGSSRPRQEILALPAPGDGEGNMKIPVSSPGLFRLPTDSFPEDETLPRGNFHDMELRLREADQHDAYRDDGAGVSAKQLYDPHGTSGRCNVPPGSGASFLSGIPEDLREGRGGPLADADLFMQRGCDYTISNRWMSL